MTARRLQTELLLQAGRLLLEYNESTREIHRALTRTARTLKERGGQFVLTDDVERVKRVTRFQLLESSVR